MPQALRRSRDLWLPAFEPHPERLLLLDIYGSINALASSSYSTLEHELLARERFRAHAGARMTVFDFIEGW